MSAIKRHEIRFFVIDLVQAVVHVLSLNTTGCYVHAHVQLGIQILYEIFTLGFLFRCVTPPHLDITWVSENKNRTCQYLGQSGYEPEKAANTGG